MFWASGFLAVGVSKCSLLNWLLSLLMCYSAVVRWCITKAQSKRRES